MSTRAFITGVSGTELSAAEREFIRRERPWGFILFRRNVEAPQQVASLVAELRDAVGEPDAPVLIDQEGGRVQRLGPPHWPAYPPGAAYGRIYDRDRHEPFVLARFRRDSRRDFLRGIQADARPDGNGVGAERRRRGSLGEGRGGADGSRHDEADGDRSLQHGRPPCEMRHTARIAHRAQGASAGGNNGRPRPVLATNAIRAPTG